MICNLGVCDSYGKSRFITFDKVDYTFNGNCTYVLAKTIENTSGPKFKVSIFKIILYFYFRKCYCHVLFAGLGDWTYLLHLHFSGYFTLCILSFRLVSTQHFGMWLSGQESFPIYITSLHFQLVPIDICALYSSSVTFNSIHVVYFLCCPFSYIV